MSSLRLRVTVAVLTYVVAVSAVVVVHGYWINERAERLVWESLLQNEFEHLVERLAQDPDYRWGDTETLHLYGQALGRPIPSQFENLSQGVHDEILSDRRKYIALVQSVDETTIVLALDISELELSERSLALTLAFWTAPTVLILVLITHFGAGWLVRPLAVMAKTISGWSADRPDHRIKITESTPREAAIVAEALNSYSERLKRFVERERAFINMASHELRTPIAVISGTVDVALDHEVPTSDARPHLERVRRTAQDMERLIALLLALAKEPDTLRDIDESIDLGALLPIVIRDHQYLAELKELTLDLKIEDAPTIQAPPQIVHAAIGNLIRNAIENSDRGTISVVAESPVRVTVTDPGHGMTDREMSSVYTKLARSGEFDDTRSGIGIDMISRLCAHLGWRLSFKSRSGKGTIAILEFVQTDT